MITGCFSLGLVNSLALPDAFLSFTKSLFINWFDLMNSCTDYFKTWALRNKVHFRHFKVHCYLNISVKRSHRLYAIYIIYVLSVFIVKRNSSHSIELSGEYVRLNHLKVIQETYRLCKCMLCREGGLPMLRPLSFSNFKHHQTSRLSRSMITRMDGVSWFSLIFSVLQWSAITP